MILSFPLLALLTACLILVEDENHMPDRQLRFKTKNLAYSSPLIILIGAYGLEKYVSKGDYYLAASFIAILLLGVMTVYDYHILKKKIKKRNLNLIQVNDKDIIIKTKELKYE